MNTKPFVGILTGILVFLAATLGSVTYAATPSSVVLLNVYEKDDVGGTYVLQQLGSAVVIDSDTIVTNAHVILDTDEKASFLYEVCETKALDRKPNCFSTAKVVKYNTEEDLAVLKLSTPSSSTTPVLFTTMTPSLGEVVQVLGYPSYGGDTITQTEGKISGFEQGYYKIDANLDSGNSGGGAFDGEGKFVGVPTFVSVGYSTLGYIVPYDKVQEILSSTGNDGTTLVSEVPDGAGAFKDFSQKKYSVNTAKSIETPYITINSPQSLGFHVENYLLTEQETGPEEIVLSDRKGKTTVTVTVHGKYDPNNLRAKQHKGEDMKLYKEKFDTVLTKDIVRNGNTRQATYIDGSNVQPGLKILAFVQRGTKGGGLGYIVETTDHDLQSFVNGIVLFLKLTDVHKKNYSIQDYIDTTSHIVDLRGMFPVYSYGFDEDNGIVVDFSFGGNSLYDGKLNIQKVEYNEESKEITYQEFGDYLKNIFSHSFSEDPGVIIEEGMLVKNKVGSIYYAIPMMTEEEGETTRTGLVYFVIKKGESVYIYTIILPFHDSATAKQQIVKFFDTVVVDKNHGFNGYGIDISEMSTVQDFVNG